MFTQVREEYMKSFPSYVPVDLIKVILYMARLPEKKKAKIIRKDLE